DLLYFGHGVAGAAFEPRRQQHVPIDRLEKPGLRPRPGQAGAPRRDPYSHRLRVHSARDSLRLWQILSHHPRPGFTLHCCRERRRSLMQLDGRIPSGSLAEKWDKRKFEMKLVNPANKRKYDVILVGSGLAGA